MKNYIKLALACSIYFSEIAVNIACGPEQDPYDMQTTYYLPHITGSGYAAFQYIPYQFLYSEREPQSESSINASLWAKHLKVSEKDIIQLMYATDSATAAALLANQTPDSLAGNSFWKALQRHPQELAYFKLTKKAENLSNIKYDYWDPAPIDTDQLLTLGEEAAAQIKNHKKGSFLYLRYAYQAARLALIGKDYAQSMEIYEHYLEPIGTKDPILGWALSNYAGATRWSGNPEKAAFLFAQVFSQRPERRILAYKNYNYIEADVKNIVSLATTKEDKFNIYAITAFNSAEPDLETLKACYDLKPTHEIIPILIGREVNKLEEKLITPFQISYGASNWYEDADITQTRADLASFRNFTLQITKDKKIKSPELGLLAAAYLSVINKENTLAKDYLSKISAGKLTGSYADQFTITQLLTRIEDWKSGTEKDENYLKNTLSWLLKKAQDEKTDSTQYSNFENAPYSLIGRNILTNILVPHYLAAKDTTKASLAALKADVFANNGLVKDTLTQNMSYATQEFWQRNLSATSLNKLIENFKNSEQRDALTAFLLADINQVNFDELYELQGTTYLREHNYKAAIQSFQQVVGPQKKELVTDYYNDQPFFAAPFIAPLKDYPKKRGTRYFSKMDYAKAMLKLVEATQTEKDPEKLANYYFQLAVGEYQTSTFGNSWMLKSYTWSSTDAHDPLTVSWDQDYKQTYTAKLWFEKALRLSKNMEFKAKCVFWLAKCQQHTYQYNEDTRWTYYEHFKESPFYQYAVSNPYFKVLKTQYGRTKLYQTAVHECSYLADFISR
ncbi:hypothetical protein J5U18_08035 [Sphingobacteriaceae bacterium WQ 2009]|uniref:Tetratricopeptide repeat-containing protein n=1 Tax=Rhinopithecimicrobium faecis TaxID=2820698 RepID=A0A8T4H8Y6_9SPHI|nr:hypothetical protein [Sphingobacteriaceae bacterium WQ 2009]